MKYMIAAILAIVLIGGYFINKSNNADKERIKQAEIAHQQKLEHEKAEELNKQYGGSPVDKETINKVVDAKMNEKSEITQQQAQELNSIILEWKDAATVAGATGRIALSQPVSKMQEIKRNLSAKKYQGCAESTRLLFEDAMNTNISAYLEFMKGREFELNSTIMMVDYQKKLELAEQEKTNCMALAI